MKTVCATLASLSLAGVAVADTYVIPPESAGIIQDVIDLYVVDGDVIQLEDGTYLISDTINTMGKAFTLRGVVGKDGSPTTVIDGQDSIRVLICESGEGPDTVFENLLITGGYTSGNGGGMYCNSTSPTLSGCVFVENTADNLGAGMYNVSGHATLTNCIFDGNFTNGSGGGMFNDSTSNPTLNGCTFTNNSVGKRGGGMHNHLSSPSLFNCTFTGNSASNGGGMYNNGSSSTLTDTTLCGNTPDQISGTWTDKGGNYVDPICTCPGDINNDGQVDGSDQGLLLIAWGMDNPLADFNADGIVDGGDLGLLLLYWGPCP